MFYEYRKVYGWPEQYENPWKRSGWTQVEAFDGGYSVLYRRNRITALWNRLKAWLIPE